MPFDPNKPANGSPNSSAEMRAQFNGLKDLIDALPTGAGITGAVVDAVTTQPPGTQAMVSVSLVGGELHFSFGIPEGAQGSQGSNGNDGQPGQQGAQGPPGEVSQTDLNNAILNMLSQSSNITNNVNTLTTVAPMDYEPLVLQEMIDKLNELVLALRR
jgi:hypothetical protein